MAENNEVYINTALDTKDLEKGVKQAERELDGLTKKYEQIQAKQKKFLELGGQKQELSKEYKAASAEVEKYGNKLETLLNRQEKIQETGGKTNTKSYQQLEYEIDQVSEKLWRAEKAQESLEDNKYVDTKQWSQMSYDLENTGNKMEEAKANYAELSSMLDQSKKPRGIERIKSALESLKNTSNKVKKSLSNMFSKSADVKKGFGTGFKNILKYTLGIRSLFVLFNKLRSALVDGFKNLAQFNNGVNPVNSAISSLKSSLTTLKNSFASAFAPILTTVAPALTLFIDKISQAVTALGMLFAKLSGASTFTKAVKVQENYAQSLGNTASNTDKATKATKRYLSPLDDLNKMESKDESSSGGAGGVSPNQMFETVDIPSAFGNLADKIKQAWENADFTEIGTIVGTKIKNALDSIDWSSIKTVADKLGKSFGTFLNGFYGTPGFAKSLGKAIGEGFNTAFTFVSSFLNSTDFSKIGSFITKALQKAFKTFDWSLLGSTLSGFVSGIFDFLSGAIEGINWKSLPMDIIKAIIKFFKGFNAKKIAKSIARLFGAAVGAVAGFIVGIGKMVADVVEKIKESWDSKKAEWEKMGVSVWDGVKLGIVNAIKNIGKWIIDNLFKPFINGFKNAFGIHSPSKVMAEMGGYIMDGLYNGIKDKISSIKQIFTTVLTTIQGVFNNVGSWFGTKFKGAWDSVKKNFSSANAKTYFNGVVSNIKNAFSGIPNWFKTTFTTAWKNVKDVFSSGGQIFNGIKDGILNGLKTVINALISGINQVVKIPFDGLNTALGKIRGVSILGKRPFENLIPTISVPQIPYLATGTVVPRQAGEFAAILGDNDRETEVVSPLSTMKQAMSEVMSEYGGKGGSYHFSAQINRKTLFDEVITEGKMRQMQNGMNPFELGRV